MSQQSERLCAKLAGAAPGGSVADLADWIAQALENAESEPHDRAKDAPTLAQAREYLRRIRQVLDRVELRLQELGA